MCMNCGCGEPEKRHQPTDFTEDDLKKAAGGSGISVEEAATNMRNSLDKVSSPTASSADVS